MDELNPVRAAGGLVWRRGAAGSLEILLVHRPRLDDWSLPKGKLRRGEHPLVGAAREVREETAIRPSLGARLPTVSYPVQVDGRAVDKVVDYWSMTVAADEGFAATAVAGLEVDAVAWVTLDEASTRLTYPRDHTVLAAFSRIGPLPAPILFIRHASADRAGWRGRDADRPLDRTGSSRARRLATLLSSFTPGRLVSASPRRCVQTLDPLAAASGLPIGVDVAFDELADPGAAAKRLRALAAGQGEQGAAGGQGAAARQGAAGGDADAGDTTTSPGLARYATVVCGQGALMPPALAALTGRSARSFPTTKGEGWVLSFRDDAVVAVDELR